MPAPVPTRLVGRHDGLVALAVCALFDAEGERLIRGLWARLEAAGIGSPASHTHGHHHPHLSYAVLREWELDRVRDTLGRLPDGGRFPANVQGTVVFPRGRVALAVAVPAEVALRQDRVTSALMATARNCTSTTARRRGSRTSRWRRGRPEPCSRSQSPRSPTWSP